MIIRKNMEEITVLMSTYNGEKYLREQLDSIFLQKNVKLKLLVRDDGSTDNTMQILQEYRQKYSDLEIWTDGKNLKPCKSFFYLIQNAPETEYYALADQDDIWDCDKLETAIDRLKRYSQEIPALYYSNLRIVDEKDVFYRNSHEMPAICRNKNEYLTDMKATGCTIVYNRALAELIHNRIPDEFTMHDAFLYIIASIFGNVIYDFEPHIDYRQHGDNSIGTYLDKKPVTAYFKHMGRLLDRNRQPRRKNADAVLSKYGEFLQNTHPREYEKLMELSTYKNSLKQTVQLLKDKELYPSSGMFRYSVLAILGLL